MAEDIEPSFSLSDAAKFSSSLRDMVDRSFLHTMKYREQQHRASRLKIHPKIAEFERKLVKRLAKIGVPMFAHCIYRTASEQNRMFAIGNSKAKAGQSAHNYGMALDLIHSTKGWDLTTKQWELVGHVGKELAAQLGLKITWGGDWKFYDPAHWELSDWKELKASS